MEKNFIIDGNITTTKNLNVQGNLNIQGSTQTVDQETLTIKGSFIAVNGEGTDLDTVDKVGIVTIVDESKAYAAPVYDANNDTLKIGLGTYEKDEDGNIIGFEFDENQGQSIATRDNAIADGNLVQWNEEANKLVDAGCKIGDKVDKVNGKGLSTNDYTTDEKNKLEGIATGANKTIVDSTLSSSSTNPIQNKVISTALNTKANTEDFGNISSDIMKNIFQAIYPIGYVYLSMNSEHPSNLFGGAWEPLAPDQTLWLTSAASGNANTHIDAGLPNITGHGPWIRRNVQVSGHDYGSDNAISMVQSSKEDGVYVRSTDNGNSYIMNFNANNGAKIKNIYRDDCTTVQPPALRVYGWRKTSHITPTTEY